MFSKEKLAEIKKSNDALLRLHSEENSDAIFRIILEYAKKHELLLYGGMAVSMMMKEKKYPDVVTDEESYTDYDFYSTDPIKDIMAIANLIYAQYPDSNVACIEAEHIGTYKLFCYSGKELMDITYMPKHMRNMIKTNQNWGNVMYATPNLWLLIC
jgi:hypothetical protein